MYKITKIWLSAVLFGLSLCVWLTCFAYQQQWFSTYQELDGNMNFSCTSQCFALIGSLSGSDYVTLKWIFQWNGVIGYGFLAGQQIIPWETLQLNGWATLDQKFSFTKLSYYTQVPASAQMLLIIQGVITWNNVWMHLGFMDFYQKIGQSWTDFWKMETLTPYSINLRYGVKLMGTSIIQYGYWIFFLGALGILFFVRWNKEKKYRKIFFLWIGIFLFIGIRNAITYTWIVDQWLKSYTYQSPDNKTFFDLWDYLTFTDKIRTTLWLDQWKKECKISINSLQDWPFKPHRTTFYLKPCSVVSTWLQADYIISYHMPLTGELVNKTILLQFNGSYLLKN